MCVEMPVLVGLAQANPRAKKMRTAQDCKPYNPRCVTFCSAHCVNFVLLYVVKGEPL